MSTGSSGRPRPFVLVIMDGWGINPRKEGNAIVLAHTPNLDKIAREWPHTAVKTSGLAVGLPEGQMGNSEVGHQNIGSRLSNMLRKITHSCTSAVYSAMAASTLTNRTWKPCSNWLGCTILSASMSMPSPMGAIAPLLAAWSS
jgi:bisphosphoglycerate-independent phosphoglycerate mutase (AlkP superfamily)